MVPTDPRSATFALVSGVKVYGGFVGTETSVAGRLGVARLTVLDGDIGALGITTDNTYHVVSIVGGFAGGGDFTLDRFVVRNGAATPPSVTPGTITDTYGGGVFADGLAANTIVRMTDVMCANNSAGEGGGVYARDLIALHLLRCTFDHDTAVNGGGLYGIFNYDVKVVNGVFRTNSAVLDGGAVFLASSSGTASAVSAGGGVASEPQSLFHNCLLVGNSADRGAAFHLGFGPLFPGPGLASLVNCTVVANKATTAGDGIFGPAAPATYVVRNSIAWNNGGSNLLSAFVGLGYVGFSDVQGPVPLGSPATISSDPGFLGPNNFDLKPLSPCANTGSMGAMPWDWLDLDGDGLTAPPSPAELLPLDLLLRPRFNPFAPTVHMGAYQS